MSRCYAYDFVASVRGDSVGPDLASGGDRRRRSRRRCPYSDELDGLRGAAAGTVLVLGVSRTTPGDGREDCSPPLLAPRTSSNSTRLAAFLISRQGKSQLACRHTRQLRRRPTPSPDAGRRTASPTASRRHLPDGGRAAPGAVPDGRTRTRGPRTPPPGRSPTEAGPGQDRSRTNCPRAGPNVG